MTGETGRIERNPCLLATARNTVECRERPLEALTPEQIRVRVEVSMVSTGTELHHIQETHTKASTFPRSTGYISVGRVVGAGSNVKDVVLGQRVLVQQSHFAHHNADPKTVKVVPDGVESVDGAAAILLGIALRGIRGGQVRLGDPVAVFGLGVIGQFAVHLAKISGAYPVIAVDPVAKRRDIATQMGADVVFDPLQPDLPAKVRAATNGEGARISIDASGTPRVIASLPDVTAAFGKVVVLGGVHGLVEFDLYTRFQKSNLTMVGCGSAYPTDYPFNEERNETTLLQMMKAGIVRPRPVLTHFVPWQQGPKMYQMLIHEKDKAIGVAFDWTAADR
jgi:2-desacetyl-2-hydroxyethyl bacteriochlorophyllide A dehydrogenase